MEDFADPEVNEVVVVCSAQSAKTLTVLAALGYFICEDPGPILWVTFSEKEAKKISNMRVMPMFELCAPIAERLPTDRTKKKTLEVYFPGAPFVLTGADTVGALQSTPYRIVICDEARSYKAGILDMISKRFRSFGPHYKKIVISTPGRERDELDTAYKMGDQRKWLVPCPECGHENEIFDWGDKKSPGGLHWDVNEETYDAERGEYRWDALRKTIRYDCWNPECEHAWRDVPRDRHYLANKGRWVATNPNAPSNVRSRRWNALLPTWPVWEDQVREFLKATRALEWADVAPLKDHMNETRGLSWTDRFQHAKEDKNLEERKVDYDPRAPWPEELNRFMTVDVQGKGGRHYKWVVRAWARRAWSRKLAHGVAWSLDEVKQVADEWAVSPHAVAFDAGNWASEVYGYVVNSGYKFKALKGDDRWHFRVDKQNLLFQVTPADPAIGTEHQGRVRPIELYVWAKYGVLDRLLPMMAGTLGQWEVPTGGVDEDYALEVTAIGRRERPTRGGGVAYEYYNKRKDDHFSDCEQMQIICASAAGLLSAPTPLEEAAAGGYQANETNETE
jgi:phage terminase large subunit GpA-like protein